MDFYEIILAYHVMIGIGVAITVIASNMDYYKERGHEYSGFWGAVGWLLVLLFALVMIVAWPAVLGIMISKRAAD